MWDLAVREEDYHAADSLLRRHAAAPLSMRLFSAFAGGDSAARARLLEEARGAENRQLQIAARYLAVYLEDFSTAERLARLDLAWRQRPALRAGAQLFLAWLEVARGRFAAAEAEFANAQRMEDVEPVVLHRGVAATLPFLAPSPTDLAAVRAQVEQWRPESASDPSASLSVVLRPQLRLYLLGLLASRQGQEAAALRYAAQLAERAAPPESRDVVHGLAQTVRADVARRGKRSADGLEALAALPGEIPLELVSAPVYTNLREFSQEHARLLRADLLAELGRDAEALRWFETGFQGSPSELAYLAPVHLRRARFTSSAASATARATTTAASSSCGRIAIRSCVPSSRKPERVSLDSPPSGTDRPHHLRCDLSPDRG
jgi:tetratricopeptide (TPR) repeat protein